MQGVDGRHWERTSTLLDYGIDGNETELLVENDTLMAFSRTEAGGNHEMHISSMFLGRTAGKASPPGGSFKRLACLKPGTG
ncbi:MAG: hypothetical protein DRN21_05065 [Thermoplasmata archaeon]|nr:MAG: hypothetical protein DRN21_05065 [Thermoplasmata archaeon]